MSNEVIEAQDAQNLPAYPNMPQGQNLPTDAINQGTVAVESQRAIAEAQSKLVIAKRFPRDEVAPIITARVDELAGEIKEALEKSGVKLGNWSNVYLTGGGVAFNRGGKDYLSSKLGRPVRDTPKRTVKMSSPIYSSTMGLMDLIIDTMEQQRQPASGVAGKISDFFRSLVGG